MKTQPFSLTIGVDIAKKKFDTAGFYNDKYKHKSFSNDETGFKAFIAWFTELYGDVKPLICMEATGGYSLPLADFLSNNGYFVSVINPAKIHAFGKSQLSRVKTDKADAKLIARYAAIMQPPLWIPPPAAIRRLQTWVHRIEDLQEMIQMENNRKENADSALQTSIDTVLTTLEAELKAIREAIKNHIDSDPDLKNRRDLLDSIPGVGEATISQLLVLFSPHRQFTQAKQAVAFVGLAPKLQESGQWRGTTHIAKNGDSSLRKALYMPAIVAWQHNPCIRKFCNRLKAKEKNGKAVVCAAMRKLIHLAFGILKSGKAFDPNYAG